MSTRMVTWAVKHFCCQFYMLTSYPHSHPWRKSNDSDSFCLVVKIQYYMHKYIVQRKSFYSLPFGQTEASIILLAQTSFQLASKAFWQAELISQFFCYSNSSKNVTCPLGMFKTKFTSPIAKPTSHGLSDTTFFALCK